MGALYYFRGDIVSLVRTELDDRLHLPAIRAAAEATALDPLFVASVVFVESKFRSRAISKSGAVGLMQLMPATANEVAEDHGIPRVDLLDPSANATLGALYLKTLIAEFEDTKIGLAAYNGGPRAVKEWIEENGGDTDIEAFEKKETRKYVVRVEKTYSRLRSLKMMWEKVRPYVE